MTSFPSSLFVLFLFVAMLHFGSAADPNLKRTVNLAYGNGGGIAITNYTPAQIINYFKEIDPPPSAVWPLDLDNGNLEPYQDLITYFQQSGTVMYPTIGNMSLSEGYNNQYNQDLARTFRDISDAVQLTNTGGYVQTAGIQDTYDFVEFLIGLNFSHIQLNPWPVQSNGEIYTFPYFQVDSAVIQCQLCLPNKRSPPFTVSNEGACADTNWTPNPKLLHDVLAWNSSIEFLINYENPPQEFALLTLSHMEQIDAFQKTINNISGSYGAPNGQVHWTPPWSHNYDPISNNTWSFMVSQLNAINGTSCS